MDLSLDKPVTCYMARTAVAGGEVVGHPGRAGQGR